MAGNSFGKAFRITTAGESHGPGNVVIVDGCPPGLELSEDDLVEDLNRRKPGQSAIVSQRREDDQPEILSGVFGGKTTGTSIAILVRNSDQRSRDYENIKEQYRPGHADFTYDKKYGIGTRDFRGGGRASARETVARVAAGAVAKKLILQEFGGKVFGYTRQVGDIVAKIDDPARVNVASIEQLQDGSPNVVRCPDHEAAAAMFRLIDEMRRECDSIGGVAELVATGVPAGLGEPVFDKLKADLGKALFSIPAVMGVEYGAGFEVARSRGSDNNDLFISKGDRDSITTQTNRHGGMLGGISSGLPIILRAAIKPTSSMARPQPSVNVNGESVSLRTLGRHDPCLLPRFVPVGEAMVALVLADHWLRWRAQCYRVAR
jgi:chorismate synthase